MDVLVTNAGHGYQSSVEEGEADRIRAQIDANVFGLFALTRAVLPMMRAQRAGRSRVQTPSTIPDYAETAGARLKATAEKGGSQAGDPVRAGEAMIRITEVEDPPRHLVLGAWGFEAVTQRLKGRLAEIEAWREASVGADFPAG
ncbi:hypothetical protein MPOCJGCO_0576 [Methylobacterium trifolii]|uniref:Short subunit dehydrogenase n=1 Tax=Methylobacterium trifolii TaxID=1003092 RepID=A0ABQ4TU96_9HYPH|nr:hypothetical protein MPOCJGCO_0576 [Methylobacterium trifolii]